MGIGLEKNYKVWRDNNYLSNFLILEYSLLNQKTSFEGEVFSGGASQSLFMGRRDERLSMHYIDFLFGVGLNKIRWNENKIGLYLSIENNIGLYSKYNREESQNINCSTCFKTIKYSTNDISYLLNINLMANYLYKFKTFDVGPHISYSFPLFSPESFQSFSEFSVFKFYNNITFGLFLKL